MKKMFLVLFILILPNILFSTNFSKSNYNIDKIVSIALNDANVSNSDSLVWVKQKQEKEFLYTVYELEFIVNNQNKYEYEIKGNGKILKKEIKILDDNLTINNNFYNQKNITGSSQNNLENSKNENITLNDAIDICLKFIGISSKKISRLKTDYEYEEGRAIYEIEFHYNRCEYDFKVDANTGKILKYEIDD